MRPLFRITDPSAYAQFKLIAAVLKHHFGDTQVVYQSNYHIVVACSHEDICRTVVSQLHRAQAWDIEVREGRKTNRFYFKLTFNKE